MGTRATKQAKEGHLHDDLRAHRFHLVRSAEEQALPAAVRAKRETKPTLAEDDYYRELEARLRELGALLGQRP